MIDPPELVIVVPSRGRPRAADEMLRSFEATCTARTRLLPVVDDNDPTRGRYPANTWTAPSRTMVQALNWAVEQLVGADEPPFAVGFMGDDHRPATPGWDSLYVNALRELADQHGAGLVYGNDLLQGRRLPTQVAMTSNVPRAVGCMAPPQFGHLFIDNVWKAWGEGAGCLRYLPDVIVEHLHPVARKADWDEGYRRVNSTRQYDQDQATWREYQADGLARDVARIRALAGGS